MEHQSCSVENEWRGHLVRYFNPPGVLVHSFTLTNLNLCFFIFSFSILFSFTFSFISKTSTTLSLCSSFSLFVHHLKLSLYNYLELYQLNLRFSLLFLLYSNIEQLITLCIILIQIYTKIIVSVSQLRLLTS